MMKLLGVTAAMLMTTTAFAEPVKMNLCTGISGFLYAKVGAELAEQLKGTIDVTLIPSTGSVDNFRLMHEGKCDALLGQSDAYYVYNATNPNAAMKFEDVGPLYFEYGQLLCNRESGIKSISGLKKRADAKIAIGPPGSGSQTTWYALTDKNKDLGKIQSIPLDGELALTRIITGREAQCLFAVSGLNTKFMKKANEVGAGKLVLASFDDQSFVSVNDDTGKSLYVYKSIPGGTYPNLQDGMFSSAVSTIAVRAEFILSSDWYARNPAVYGDLSTVILRMGHQKGGIE